jgi:hypothetical protein
MKVRWKGLSELRVLARGRDRKILVDIVKEVGAGGKGSGALKSKILYTNVMH